MGVVYDVFLRKGVLRYMEVFRIVHIGRRRTSTERPSSSSTRHARPNPSLTYTTSHVQTLHYQSLKPIPSTDKPIYTPTPKHPHVDPPPHATPTLPLQDPSPNQAPRRQISRPTRTKPRRMTHLQHLIATHELTQAVRDEGGGPVVRLPARPALGWIIATDMVLVGMSMYKVDGRV